MLRGLCKHLEPFKMTLKIFQFDFEFYGSCTCKFGMNARLIYTEMYCYSWGKFKPKFPRLNWLELPNLYSSTVGEHSFPCTVFFFSILQCSLNSLSTTLFTSVVSIIFTWNAWALPRGKSILLLLILPAVWTNPVCGHHNQGTSLLVGGITAV